MTPVPFPTELYTGVAPCRIIDTRLTGGPMAGVGHFHSYGNLSAQGGSSTCGIPYSASSLAINITAVSATDGGTGYVRGWPYLVWTNLTATLLNYGPGINMSNMVNMQLCKVNCVYNFDLAVYGDPVDLVVDVIGYYRPTAFAHMEASGTVGISSGVVVGNRPSTGFYALNFDRPVDSCVASVASTDSSNNYTFSVGPNPWGTSPESIRVTVRDASGALANAPFNIRYRCGADREGRLPPRRLPSRNQPATARSGRSDGMRRAGLTQRSIGMSHARTSAPRPAPEASWQPRSASALTDSPSSAPSAWTTRSWRRAASMQRATSANREASRVKRCTNEGERCTVAGTDPTRTQRRISATAASAGTCTRHHRSGLRPNDS